MALYLEDDPGIHEADPEQPTTDCLCTHYTDGVYECSQFRSLPSNITLFFVKLLTCFRKSWQTTVQG